MTKRMRAVLLVALGAAVLAIGVSLALRQDRPEGAAALMEDGGTKQAAVADPARAAVRRPSLRGADAGADAIYAASPVAAGAGVFAVTTWGSGPGQLGRDRPQEGNPEAPMSLTLDSLGNAVVLDQVNNRLTRFGKDGKPLGSVPLTVQGAQDVAMARDGTAAVLDRLVDKTVALMDPNGKLLGELPVEGRGIEEGGGVTGVFVDGKDVYVEREHATLVRIGDTAGKADPERPEIPGRPTRDGLSFITAGMTEATTGRVYVSSIDRASLAHRFTRELRLGVQLHGLMLLDTDRAGVIYLGAVAELPTGQPDPATRAVILLTCLDPLDGRPIGKAELPANTSADETFRELTVFDEGGVLFAQRSEQAVTMQRYDCR
jgi:hypothetical protein